MGIKEKIKFIKSKLVTTKLSPWTGKKGVVLLKFSPAMKASSIHSFLSPSPSPYPFTATTTKGLSPLPLFRPYPRLNFQYPQLLNSNRYSRFAATHKFPNLVFPVGSSSQLSDDDIEVESDDDDEEEDDVAAEEYDVVAGEISEQYGDEEDEEVLEATEGVGPRYEEFKWQRVERIRNEVREFGEDIIDVEELASVYDFRIDKFQVFPSLPRSKD